MKKVSVLYDNQIFCLQKIGGISRYFYELIKRNENSILPLLYTENFYLKESKKNILKSKFIKIINFLINKVYMIFVLKTKNYDIFHPTYYDSYFLNLNIKTPFVITVYDMIHEIYGDSFFANNKTTTILKRKLCEKADGIIAISEKTKEDIINYFNINPDKIKVIYLGSNLNKNIKDIKLPKKYILFTGGRKGYKNFDLFLKSISKILIEDKDLYLVCTGESFTNKEIENMKKLKIENKVHQILANDDEMYTIYYNAECFVFPSLYEGFGIPILEAFEAGTPLVLSNTSCFPEIAGDAGEYFDPINEKSIETAIKNVLYDPIQKMKLIKNGKERLKKFNWDKTSKETLEFYESILKKTNEKQ